MLVQVVVQPRARDREILPTRQRILALIIAHPGARAASEEEVVGLIDVDAACPQSPEEGVLHLGLPVDGIFEPVMMRVILRGAGRPAVRPVRLEHGEAGCVDEVIHEVIELIIPARGEACVQSQVASRRVDGDPLVAHIAAVAAMASIEADQVIPADLDAFGLRIRHLLRDVAQVLLVGCLELKAAPEAEDEHLEPDLCHLVDGTLEALDAHVGRVEEDRVLSHVRREQLGDAVAREGRALQLGRVGGEQERAE